MPTTDRRVVVNTGPLIALARIGALEIPGRLDLTFMAPEEVRHELEEGVRLGHPPVQAPWLTYVRLAAPLNLMVSRVLDPGEGAVIQLALEQRIGQVCIDEVKGRRMALAVGLRVTGAFGLLGRAKRDGLISAVRPYVERAAQTDIRYHGELIRRFLQAMGE